MTLSEKIRFLRKQKTLSQEQLAEKLNVSRQAVSKWESNQSVPDVDKIIAISKIFEVTTDYLLKNTDEQNRTLKTEFFQHEKNFDKKFISGFILFPLGVLSIIVIWIVFINTNRNYFFERGNINYQGFSAFLKTYGGLEIIYCACIIMIFIGLILIFYKQVSFIIKIHRETKMNKEQIIGVLILLLTIVISIIPGIFPPLKTSHSIASHLTDYSSITFGSNIHMTYFYFCINVSLYLLSLSLILFSHIKTLSKIISKKKSENTSKIADG